MTRYIFENIASYSDAEYEADLARVSAQRREHALRCRMPDDRKRSVKAYMLLMQGLRQDYGLSGIVPELDFLSQGKPVLRAHPELHFSLSHTKNAVLCVIDTLPVGADIECTAPLRDRLIDYICSPAEAGQVRTASDPPLAFARIWTRKESCVKLTGSGFSAETGRTIGGADAEYAGRSGRALVQLLPSEDTSRYHFIGGEAPDGSYAWSVCTYAPEALPAQP